MKFINIIKVLYFKLISANKVAKILGVKYGKNCSFGTKKFDSEPYLITVGDNFRTSSDVTFITHDGSVHVLRNIYDTYKEIDLFGPIDIGNNVFIGLGATILPNTRIGNNVIVGAGSLVRGTLKDNSVYAGVPIRFICSIEEYEAKHKEQFVHSKYMEPDAKEKYIRDLYSERF